MKIRDIIQNVNKSKPFEDQVFIYEIASSQFNLEVMYWDNQPRLTSYYIGNWHCTDARVGYKVYFFDDEPVAVSSQLGRKCTENFDWISHECYNKVKSYVISFMDVCDRNNPTIVDLDQDFGDIYKISYYEQMYDYHKNNAIYNNESVKVVDHKDSFNDDGGKYIPETVKIQYENGETEWIETKQLSFPFNLITT